MTNINNESINNESINKKLQELKNKILSKISKINKNIEENITEYNNQIKNIINFDNINFEFKKCFYSDECINNDINLYSQTNTSDTCIKNEVFNMNLVGGVNGDVNNSNNKKNTFSNIINSIDDLNLVQKKFNNLINTYRKYNILYVKTLNHIKFIDNYLKLVTDNNNKNYQVYEYIGYNTIIYYKEIITKIIEEMKNKTIYGRYFFKYYYINIYILESFLSWLIINWQPYTYCVAFPEEKDNLKYNYHVKKVISKLHLYNNDFIKNPQIKKGVFIFNAMKDLLDKYKSISSPPVAVYLRINKKPQKLGSKPPDEIFKKDTDPNNIGYLSNENIKMCNNNSKTDNNIDNSKTDIGNIKFAEIFDSESFNDNAVLSKYMSIPTFLSQGKSIMLLTYGYSGVGKTFTVFGTKDKSGMLQSSLNNIQQKGDIYFRAYELYGMAFPYKSYWQNKDGTPKNSNEYYHFIYDYTKDQNTPTTYNANVMTTFIDNNNTFEELKPQNLKNFETIINNIDNTRRAYGRIKKTVNNPQSSRSIMIFDFRITLADKSSVDFVIVDLPGKENIYETYITQNSCINTQSKAVNIKLEYDNANSNNTQQIIINKNEISDGDNINTNTQKYNDEKYDETNDSNTDTPDEKIDNTRKDVKIRNMAFMSPLSLMLIKEIANSFTTKFMNLYTNNEITLTYLGTDYSNNDSNYYKIKEHFKNKSQELGLEIMRHLINNNKFDLLNEFYTENFFNEEVLENKEEKCDNKNFAMAPFEGYYINENIIGLLSTLLNRLKISKLPNGTSAIKEQYDIFTNEAKGHKDFTKNTTIYKGGVATTDTYNYLINNEIKSQTYFFRFLSRMSMLPTNFCGKPLYEWINDSYDYNKAYNIENPPISALLAPYFNKITNFYVFYVVSNDSKEICDKQIKLIEDSKVFLDQLSNYKPDTLTYLYKN